MDRVLAVRTTPLHNNTYDISLYRHRFRYHHAHHRRSTILRRYQRGGQFYPASHLHHGDVVSVQSTKSHLLQALEIGLLIGAAVVLIVVAILVAIRGGVQVHEHEMQYYEAETGGTLPPRTFEPHLTSNETFHS